MPKSCISIYNVFSNIGPMRRTWTWRIKVSDSLKLCSPETLPILFTLLKLFATLPLSSCSCERSASILRRLNNYLRRSQSEEWLSALALIHCNCKLQLVHCRCKLIINVLSCWFLNEIMSLNGTAQLHFRTLCRRGQLPICKHPFQNPTYAPEATTCAAWSPQPCTTKTIKLSNPH